jgi:hypothetical protein
VFTTFRAGSGAAIFALTTIYAKLTVTVFAMLAIFTI